MDLVRKRIIEIIDKALKVKRLIVFIAPIGYGKTTLAKQYFASKNLKYLDNTFYGDVVTQADYDAFVERFKSINGVIHMDWNTDTKRIEEYLKDKFEFVFHDNIEHAKYLPLVINRSNIYLQGKNVLKTFTLSRGSTYFKFDEMRVKGIAEILDKTILAFTKEEIIEYAKINDISISNADINYCMQELKGIPLFVTMYLNGGAIRVYKPYLSVYKSSFYDALSKGDQEILQMLVLFKTFSIQDIKSVCVDSTAVENLIEQGYRYDGYIDYDITSGKYSIDDFFCELVTGLMNKEVIVKYYKKIVEMKIADCEYEQALNLIIMCCDRAQVIELYNGELYKLEQPTRYEMFNKYIKKFTALEIAKYPYAYLKFIYLELLNVSNEAIKDEFLAYYNNLISAECNDDGKDILIQNCQMIMMLSGIIGIAEFKKILLISKNPSDAIKIVDIKKIFKNYYVLMSLRSYAPLAELEKFCKENIYEFQQYYGVTADAFNQLYDAEYDVITGQWQSAKEKLFLIVAKADIARNYELAIGGRVMLARASYFTKSIDKISGIISEIDRIGATTNLHKYICSTASQYVKQFLGKDKGFMLSIENVSNTRTLNSYGGFYLKEYIMKCFIAEKRYDELKIYLAICREKCNARTPKTDETLILLYQAILDNCLGESNSAVNNLIKCINLASLDGIVDILIGESNNIMPLLVLIEKKHIDEIRDTEYFNKLITLNTGFVAWQNIQSDKLLSERESEILKYMSKNLKRKEIAEVMYLSPETIKKYMQSLYKKLGTDNYTQALLNAQNLDLV